MGERKERRRRGWFDLFDDVDRFFEELMKETLESKPDVMTRISKPFIYGFSMTIGPDGKPVIKEFGNVRRGRMGPTVSEVREPIVDVINEKDRLVVITELPGVEKDEIDLETSEEKLLIRVDTPARKYEKSLDLPSRIIPSKSEASYKNGILEVRLKKAA